MYTEKQGNVECTRVWTSVNMVDCLRQTPVMSPLTPADVFVFLFSICEPSDIHLRGYEDVMWWHFLQLRFKKHGDIHLALFYLLLVLSGMWPSIFRVVLMKLQWKNWFIYIAGIDVCLKLGKLIILRSLWLVYMFITWYSQHWFSALQ